MAIVIDAPATPLPSLVITGLLMQSHEFSIYNYIFILVTTFVTRFMIL